MAELKTARISDHCLWQSYLLGKALRIGDTDSFLTEYDKCLQTLEDENGKLFELEDIKELARIISDMSVSQYYIIEESFREGYINNSNEIVLGQTLNDVLVSLSSKLFADSGICSDGGDSIDINTSYTKNDQLIADSTDHHQPVTNNPVIPKLSSLVTSNPLPVTTKQSLMSHKHVIKKSHHIKTNNDLLRTKCHWKKSEKKRLQQETEALQDCTSTKTSSQSVNGLYMYDNGDIVKVERRKRYSSTSFSRQNNYFESTNYHYSDHYSNVNYLWKNWCDVQNEVQRTENKR